MEKADTVRECFASYVRQDRDTAERLIGEPFTFTSPQDDHIDRTAYFERCFPSIQRYGHAYEPRTTAAVMPAKPATADISRRSAAAS